MSKQHWTAERNGLYKTSPRSKRAPISDVVIRYDPTPNPPLDDKGRPKSFSLTFPALALTAWVGEQGVVGPQIARELNLYPEMLDLVRLLEKAVEFEIEKAKWAGDEEGARLKLLTLDRVQKALAANDAPIQPLEASHEAA